MTDFSKLFTDPSAEVYGPDATESAMWQQSSTNPFAVLHAIAARRNANNRRDQYGEQLAAHDQRAMTGARTLMADENKYGTLAELIKQQMIDPATAASHAGLLDPSNQEQYNELASVYTAGKRANAFKAMGEGQQALKAGGRRVDNLSDLSSQINVGKTYLDTIPGEDVEAAKLKNELGTQTTAEQLIPTAENGLPTDRITTITTKRPLQTGGTSTGKTGSKLTQAPPTNVAPPERTKKAAPGYSPQEKIVPGPATTAVLASRPQEQKATLVKLKNQGLPTANAQFQLVPNTVEIDEEGNVWLKMRSNTGGRVTDIEVVVTPDGRFQTR